MNCQAQIRIGAFDTIIIWKKGKTTHLQLIKKIENRKVLGLYLSHQNVETFYFSNLHTYSVVTSGGNTADTSEVTSENTLRIFKTIP